MIATNTGEQPQCSQESPVTEAMSISYSKERQSVVIDASPSSLSVEDAQLAAILIRDARTCKNMTFKTDVNSLRSYLLFQHWIFKWVLVLCIWGNMGLAIFEKPAIAGLGLPYWITMIVELCFITYFFVRFFHNMHFDIPKRFWKDPKNITILSILILTLLDMLGYIIWVNVASTGTKYAVRWSRVLRPFLVINFPEGRQVRKAFRNIRKTLPDIIHILVLFLCSLAIFALMALKLLQRRNLLYPDNSPYFQSYPDAYWDLYVLVTTANNPDVMMPAYDNNRFFALFFILFSVVNEYIFMSIVLASVYNNYKRHLKEEVRNNVGMKRNLLDRAFNVLKERQAAGLYKVSAGRWHAVMGHVAPHYSRTQVDLLLSVLDEAGDATIDRKQFLQVADLLNIRLLEVRDQTTFIGKTFPGCFTSRPSEFVKKVVRYKGFRLFFDLAILLNAICIGMNIESAEWFFIALFTIEILLKLYTYGLVKFFKVGWNVFDFLVILAAAVVTIIDTVGANYAPSDRTLDFILVLRVLRLVRLVGSIERFQIIVTTVVNIGPSIMTYGGVIFVLYYVYAIIGMELFHDLFHFPAQGYENGSTNCGNPKLNASEFAIKFYCNNNFNDIASAFVILFELMVVNQWHILTEGFVLVTHQASVIFFISFHIICVVLLLNIFTAFVLEIFLLEYNLSGNSLEDNIEAKIRNMGLSKGLNPGKKHPKVDKISLVDNILEEDVSHQAEEGGTPSLFSALPWPITAIGGGDAEVATPGANNGTLRYFQLKRKSTKHLEELLQGMFQEELNAELEMEEKMGAPSNPLSHWTQKDIID